MRHRPKAYTLIELSVVLLIIGVLFMLLTSMADSLLRAGGATNLSNDLVQSLAFCRRYAVMHGQTTIFRFSFDRGYFHCIAEDPKKLEKQETEEEKANTVETDKAEIPFGYIEVTKKIPFASHTETGIKVLGGLDSDGFPIPNEGLYWFEFLPNGVGKSLLIYIGDEEVENTVAVSKYHQRIRILKGKVISFPFVLKDDEKVEEEHEI